MFTEPWLNLLRVCLRTPVGILTVNNYAKLHSNRHEEPPGAAAFLATPFIIHISFFYQTRKFSFGCEIFYRAEPSIVSSERMKIYFNEITSDHLSMQCNQFSTLYTARIVKAFHPTPRS